MLTRAGPRATALGKKSAVRGDAPICCPWRWDTGLQAGAAKRPFAPQGTGSAKRVRRCVLRAVRQIGTATELQIERQRLTISTGKRAARACPLGRLTLNRGGRL